MLVKIEYVADHPDAIPILASWLFREWAYRSPDGSQSGMEDRLKERLNRDRLPFALVADEYQTRGVIRYLIEAPGA